MKLRLKLNVKMADQEQGVSAPNPPTAPVQAGQQAQQQQHHVAPQVSTAQGLQLVHLNWSYFKPEFPGKPDEDTEAHLLHTNGWMNTHHFIGGVKVQIFCLRLLGKATLW